MLGCIECNKSFSRRDSLLRHKKLQTHLTKKPKKLEKKIILDDNNQLLTLPSENVYNPTEIIRNKMLTLREIHSPNIITQVSKSENNFSNSSMNQINEEEKRKANHNISIISNDDDIQSYVDSEANMAKEKINENHDSNKISNFYDDVQSYNDSEDNIKCSTSNILVDELRLLLSTRKTGRRVFEIISQLRIHNVIK